MGRSKGELTYRPAGKGKGALSMKNFNNLILCDWHSERVEVHVAASLLNDALTISGQDLGPAVEDSWGDSDYEYWYRFSRQNTEKLFAVICGDKDPKEALLREFGGEEGCRKLREICKENGIEYQFSSYV